MAEMLPKWCKTSIHPIGFLQESGRSESQKSNEKMFVGGLRDTTTEDDVRAAFQEYGNIKSIELIKDKATNKTRGFCFVTFDDYDPVDKCVCM